MTNQPKQNASNQDNKPTSAIDRLRGALADESARLNIPQTWEVITKLHAYDAIIELSDKLELESRAKGKLFEYIAEHKKRLDELSARLDNVGTTRVPQALEDWLQCINDNEGRLSAALAVLETKLNDKPWTKWGPNTYVASTTKNADGSTTINYVDPDNDPQPNQIDLSLAIEFIKGRIGANKGIHMHKELCEQLEKAIAILEKHSASTKKEE